MTDLILTDAPLWDRYPWFFAAYDDAAAPRGPTRDATDAAAELYLASRHDQLLDEALVATVVARLQREVDDGRNNFTPTWEIALWTAALREANHDLRRVDITQLIARVKNHIYSRHTRGGTLMSSSDRMQLDYSVLLAAVPFGVFDPEDLALVAAVRSLAESSELERAAPEERMLLAWYFAEQGTYARSRTLLGKNGAPSLSRIVSGRLKTLSQLGERFFRHQPFGNGNRYEPMLEERFPKLVTDTDDVFVRAQASPLSAAEPLELLLSDAVIAGTFKGDCWEFMLPRGVAGSTVNYALRFAHHPGETIGPFKYEVLTRRHGGRVTLSGKRLEVVPDASASFVPMTVGAITVADVTWLEATNGSVHEVALTLSHPPCGIYGLGERYNALDQAGNRVDQFVYNQYKDQGLRTYIPMPVFYTDAGFGLHIDTTSYSWFDFSNPGETRLGVEAGSISLDLFDGSVSEQIAQFMTATGEPANVPSWALGPWMSSNNWDSDAEVRNQVALTNAHGIPATVLVIEAWSDEATFYIFNDAQYAERPGGEAFAYEDFTFPEWGRWPDPRGLVEHLHNNGLKLILWQIPVIKQAPSLRHGQKQRDEAHFIESGFGVHHPDGTPLRLPEGWFKDSLLMDFTNPDGVAWWFEKRQYLNDLGVDGYKTDGGEMVWGNDLRFADGTTGLTNRNKYPRDYIAAYYRFAQQNGGICFSRAGYTGAQTFPAHWAGDERSTWDAFKRSILAGLSAGMSGVIFWGWDLGGFSGEVPSAELFIRSAQMACFCPIMQYHAESKAEFNQDRTPWNIAERSGDDRALAGYAFCANLRMQLLPYLTREAAHCVAAKTPLMRAMLLDHQNDAQAKPLWDQYRLGRDLLVAPVIREGDIFRDVYLPEGRWWHLLQNRWYDGGRTHRVEAPLEEIPVYLREGALLSLGFDDEVRLGSTMRSGVNDPKHKVALLALKPGSRAELDGVTVTIDAAGNVAAEIADGWTLVMTDAPASIAANGRSVTPRPLVLAGVPLSAVSA
jgi:alpha-glucosidase (family GH31 glycosyl hydrolase)